MQFIKYFTMNNAVDDVLYVPSPLRYLKKIMYHIFWELAFYSFMSLLIFRSYVKSWYKQWKQELGEYSQQLRASKQRPSLPCKYCLNLKQSIVTLLLFS